MNFFIGTKITFEGEGDENDQNTIAGDIVFLIRDKPHPIFERSNSDLIFRVKLNLKQALLGTTISIPFLDSTKPPYQLRSHQEIIRPQTERRFLNEGLPYPKDPTRRGDLIVKFDILFPSLLNGEQRTLVDCCFSNSSDMYDPYDSVLHTTVIENTQQQQQQQQQKPQTPSPSHHQQPSPPSQQPQPSPPSQQQQPAPNSNSTAPPKPQSTNSNNNNNNNIYHNRQQKAFTRQSNNDGHRKSPNAPSKSPNKIKISPVRTSGPMPSSSSPSSVFISETFF